MGCVASRLEEEEEVVSICRERKGQLKLAVERRYALADAHYRYCKSLSGVSAAISLFGARHSSPHYDISTSSPPKETLLSNPLFLQQAPTQPTKETVAAFETCTSSSDEEEEEEEIKNEREEETEQLCGYFYMDMPQTMASPQRDFGWDFFNFNPFNNVMRPELMSVYNRMSEEELRAVREQEGIPDLEDEEEGGKMEDGRKGVVVKETENAELGTEAVKAGGDANVRQEEHQHEGFTVIDTPVRGRELLEALKDIADHFIKAYDSGKDVSRMLECNRVHFQSNLEELKESSNKLMKTITWKSASSRSSSSCKSIVASSSKNSPSWTEFSNDLFDDDYGGMNSGSHSLTLARLYAWEKKLYQQVKDGDSIRRIYERKCNHLKNQDVRGDEGLTVDKSRAAIKDLYSRILVAIRSAETISNQIEKLIGDELEPQIRELIQGMTRTWKIMLESHEIQNKIIYEVKTFTCPTYGKFCNESQRLATHQLEIELLNWRLRFTEYVAAQKNYIDALFRWLSKFIGPEVEFYSPHCVSNGPPLLVLCHDWLECMDKLPDKGTSFAIKSCAVDVRALWVQQGRELQQKKKVDRLSKEVDKKTMAFQKAENRLIELRLTDKSTEMEMDNRAESFVEGKEVLESLRRRVDMEKEKHRKLMHETERITLNGIQTGFCGVFESLTEFSRAALKMYNELSSMDNAGKKRCTECSLGIENGSR